MFYYVKKGDTLARIAFLYGSNINTILNSNLICFAGLMHPGQILIIPEHGQVLPKAGAFPYYVVQSGDTIYCLARQTGTTPQKLLNMNELGKSNYLYPGNELLVINEITEDPEELMLDWEKAIADNPEVYGLTEHNTFYQGSFNWAALGKKALPYLSQLLRHNSDIIKRYSVLSLARMAVDEGARQLLRPLLKDTSLSDLATIALTRIDLAERGLKRVHITLRDSQLLSEPSLDAPSRPLLSGTSLIVLRWHIPSPTSESGPKGDIQIYDRVQLPSSGQIGFLPRLGYNQINFV